MQVLFHFHLLRLKSSAVLVSQKNSDVSLHRWQDDIDHEFLTDCRCFHRRSFERLSITEQFEGKLLDGLVEILDMEETEVEFLIVFDQVLRNAFAHEVRQVLLEFPHRGKQRQFLSSHYSVREKQEGGNLMLTGEIEEGNPLDSLGLALGLVLIERERGESLVRAGVFGVSQKGKSQTDLLGG